MKNIFLRIGVICFLLSFNYSYSQSRILIGITVIDVVDFVVSDQWGRKTGNDPRGQGLKSLEIPGTNYSLYNDGSENWSIQFSMAINSPMDDGLWNIKFIGDTLAQFSYHIDAYPDDETFQKVNTVIKSFLDKDAEQTYKFTYYGNPSTPAKVEKIITISTLAQDVSAGGKLDLIGNQTYLNSLNSKITQMTNFYNAGNKQSAHNKLNDIKAQVQSAYLNPLSTAFVNEYAYNILIEDIQLTFTLIGYTGPIEEMRMKK